MRADARDRNTQLARELEGDLIERLSSALNRYHQVALTEGQWGLMIGPWLRALVATAIQRYGAIDQCLGDFEVSTFTFVPTVASDLVPVDTLAAAWMVTDPVWSNWFDSQILLRLGTDDPRRLVEQLPSADTEAFEVEPQPQVSRSLTPIRSLVNRIARRAMILAQRQTDIVFFNTCLPRRDLILTQIRSGQFPVVPEVMGLESGATGRVAYAVDIAGRHQMCASLDSGQLVGLHRFLVDLAPQQLPRVFVEGYSSLRDSVSRLPLPSRPRSIVTANAFAYNEQFKCWLASKKSDGSKYIAIQHGNNYGTHRWWNPNVEEVTSDAFITWGWDGGGARYIPGFITKSTSRSRKRGARSHLLLVESASPFRRMVWDEYVEFLRYFDDQLEFVGRLREDLRSNLVLRLHYESLQLGFNEVGRWKSSYPEVRIDMGQGSIERLWADSRLVVHSYDSTGLLECLAANTPSIAFWQNGLEHVMDDALPYYRLLVDAGIVHLGPLGAADKVAAVWEDVDEWWRSDLVQEARMEFAGRFARTSPNLPRDFARLVKESL